MADQEFLNEALDDEKTIAFIKSYLPQDFGWISSPKLFSKKFSTMAVIVV